MGTVHDLTVQGNQAARSWALWHLLERHDLPTVSTWMIDASTGTLTGLLLTEGRDPDSLRRVVNAWAGFLHVPVEETTVTDVTTVAAEGPCEYGVRVRIYTQLPASIEEVVAA